MYKFEGKSYGKEFKPITEIAKLVKDEIHATIPGIKVGVTSNTFSMGRSITVTIKAMPIARYIYDTKTRGLKESEEWDILNKKLREIADSYNRIETDAQSDYFSYYYYSSITVDFEARQEGNIKLHSGEYAILEDRDSRSKGYHCKLKNWKGIVFEANLLKVSEGFDTEILVNGVFYWKGIIDKSKAYHEIIEELTSRFEEV